MCIYPPDGSPKTQRPNDCLQNWRTKAYFHFIKNPMNIKKVPDPQTEGGLLFLYLHNNFHNNRVFNINIQVSLSFAKKQQMQETGCKYDTL